MPSFTVPIPRKNEFFEVRDGKAIAHFFRLPFAGRCCILKEKDVGKMKIRERYVLQKIGDRAIAVSLGGDKKAVTLNDTGAFLWEKLTEEKTEEQLKEALLAEYETDEATARRAVEDFVNTLKKENLLA